VTVLDALARGLGAVLPTGAIDPRLAPADVLVHGASAGEVKAAVASLPALLDGTSQTALLTTRTATGLLAGAQAILPRDTAAGVAALFDRVRPRVVVLIEAELWPNLLRGAVERGIPVAVLGARMSPRTLRHLRLVPATARAWLARVHSFAAASPGDLVRLVDAGADPASVMVCGWLKWPPGAATPVRPEGDLLVLGSAWPGEIRALRDVLRGTPWAPTHRPWRVVARHAAHGPALRAEARRLPGTIEVVDRFGVLRSAWAESAVAVVGGGWRGRGVHDLLEPLALGRSPWFHSGRGDAADIGRTLVGCGLAWDLAAGPPSSVMAVSTEAWARLREAWDGRERGGAFFRSRGLPVGAAAP
jgi:3-deoxy-D-manno-octulosonic-acid transferase